MSLNPDTWAIIATIIVVNFGLVAWLRSDIGKLQDGLNGLRERIARLEGKTDLLLQGLQVRIEPKAGIGDG